MRTERDFMADLKQNRLPAWIYHGYTVGVIKVLVSLPETDLQVIDAAAQKAGESRSSFVRRAALAEARRMTRPIDDPKVRRSFSGLTRRAEGRTPISTSDALAARDRGRR
jgi:hypothetical protein